MAAPSKARIADDLSETKSMSLNFANGKDVLDLFSSFVLWQCDQTIRVAAFSWWKC